ncbi:MAG: hypothetical protein K9M17_02820 [Mariprofundaceae bacterium]|nr:hypothetical protein [Mariprofundaceae bacterium]
MLLPISKTGIPGTVYLIQTTTFFFVSSEIKKLLSQRALMWWRFALGIYRIFKYSDKIKYVNCPRVSISRNSKCRGILKMKKIKTPKEFHRARMMKAFENGAAIQSFDPAAREWVDAIEPAWTSDLKFRIKPHSWYEVLWYKIKDIIMMIVMFILGLFGISI